MRNETSQISPMKSIDNKYLSNEIFTNFNNSSKLNIQKSLNSEKFTEPSKIETIPQNQNYSNDDSLFDKSVINFKSKENFRIYSIDMYEGLTICPRLYTPNKNEPPPKEIDVLLPDWISASNIQEFFIYYNDDSFQNFSISVRKLLMISDYFGNNSLVEKIINKEIIPYLNKNNALLFLDDSYEKLQHNSKIKSWFDLFYSCIQWVARNFIYFIEKEIEKIKKVNNKVMEEIIYKFFQIYHNSCDSMSLSSESFQKIILILFQMRKVDNIFDLLNCEYERINSNEIKEELESTNPVLSFPIKSDITNFYQEMDKVIFEKNEFSFILYNKKTDNSFNTIFKMNFQNKFKSSFKTLTVISICRFNDKQDISQFSINYVINPDTYYNMISVENFKSKIHKIGFSKEVNYQIFIKICYLHSAIQNFITLQFKFFSSDTKFMKLQTKDLFSILKNKFLNKKNEDEVIFILSSWILRENKISDEMLELIQIINWKEVSIEAIFEFVIKFSKIIQKLKIEKQFEEIIQMKMIQSEKNINNKNLNGINLSSLIAKALINSSEKINFLDVYSQIIKKPDLTNERSSTQKTKNLVISKSSSLLYSKEVNTTKNKQGFRCNKPFFSDYEMSLESKDQSMLSTKGKITKRDFSKKSSKKESKDKKSLERAFSAETNEQSQYSQYVRKNQMKNSILAQTASSYISNSSVRKNIENFKYKKIINENKNNTKTKMASSNSKASLKKVESNLNLKDRKSSIKGEDKKDKYSFDIRKKICSMKLNNEKFIQKQASIPSNRDEKSKINLNAHNLTKKNVLESPKSQFIYTKPKSVLNNPLSLKKQFSSVDKNNIQKSKNINNQTNESLKTTQIKTNFEKIETFIQSLK